MSTPTFLLEQESIPIPKNLARLLRSKLKTRASDAAMFLQQLHYWIVKGEGIIHKGLRWIWNTYGEWLKQFSWLSEWDFRIIAKALRELDLIRFEQLLDHGRNRTGCYTLNYKHEWLKLLQAHHPLDMTTDGTGDSPTPAPDDCATNITETTNPHTTDTTTRDAVEKETVVEEDGLQPTDEEVGIVVNEIRALSPHIDLNKTVRNHIRLNWANVPAAIAYIKEAIRTWKVKPDFNWTGQVVKALKTQKREESQPPPKQYPRPSLDQLDSLGSLGKLFSTVLNEPGYPEVVAVEIGGRAIVWWEALKLRGFMSEETSDTARLGGSS